MHGVLSVDFLVGVHLCIGVCEKEYRVGFGPVGGDSSRKAGPEI